MNKRLHTLVLAGAALLLAPRLAFAFGTVEGFYGLTRPPSANLRDATNDALRDRHLFKDSLQIAGGDVLLNFGGPLQIGAIADTSWASHSGSQTALGGLLGLRFDPGVLRIDLMGEAGGHHYGNFSNVQGSKPDQWFAYLGVRPGVAFHVGGSRMPGLLVGVWTFARWDLNTKHVPVTVTNSSGAVSNGNVRLGGPSIGATLRVGFDF